jgi:hypothetical protein
MRYSHILFAALCTLPIGVFAQNETDALRLSQVNGAATARALGLGGAGGSYGADFSSLSINPAGIGVYRSSELMITPVLRINSGKGTYLGNTASDDVAKIGLNNFGVVFTNAARGNNYANSDWKTFSLGIGYNRIADFNTAGYYKGRNTQSSITEGFAADALINGWGQNMVPPYGFLAYNGFLVYDDLTSIPYENIILEGGALDQSKSWSSKGGINEWNLSFGGNYREQLLLGASLGLVSYKYEKTTRYREEDATGDRDNDFDYMQFNEYLSTSGLGVNLKLGAIYVVDKSFRLGASFHSPTWSAFNDLADYDLTSNTEQLKARTGQQDSNPESYVVPDNQYQFDYSLRSPWRGVLSATAFMGQYGFVTVDYEYAAYNAMRYNFSGNDNKDYERSVNQAIKDTYKGAHSIRLGVEGKADNFLGRLGFAYQTSALRNAADYGGERMDFTAGIGGRFGGFFIDLAYVHSIYKYSEFGYPILAAENQAMGIRKIPVGIADIKNGNNLVALTVGFKF